MNLIPISELDAAERESVQEFVDQNALVHETLFAALLESGVVIPHFPLWSDDGMGRDWLLVHDLTHKAECTALGLGLPPDLDTLDTANQSQVDDWVNNHVLLHQVEAAVAGL